MKLAMKAWDVLYVEFNGDQLIRTRRISCISNLKYFNIF